MKSLFVLFAIGHICSTSVPYNATELRMVTAFAKNRSVLISTSSAMLSRFGVAKRRYENSFGLHDLHESYGRQAAVFISPIGRQRHNRRRFCNEKRRPCLWKPAFHLVHALEAAALRRGRRRKNSSWSRGRIAPPRPFFQALIRYFVDFFRARPRLKSFVHAALTSSFIRKTTKLCALFATEVATEVAAKVISLCRWSV